MSTTEYPSLILTIKNPIEAAIPIKNNIPKIIHIAVLDNDVEAIS